MKYLLVFFMLFFPSYGFSGCRHIKEADRVVSAFLKELQKRKKNISVFGSGGSMMYDVEEISLSFSTQGCVDIKEARKLLIYIVESLLKKVNSDLGIRRYLHNYPFTNKNLSIALCFYDKNGKHIMPPYITCVGIMFGEIDYSLQNLEDPVLLDEVHRETYEEALKIVYSGQ